MDDDHSMSGPPTLFADIPNARLTDAIIEDEGCTARL